MASNIREFNVGLDNFIDQGVPEAADRQMRALLLEGLRGVVLSTPVDTGRARGAWEVELEAATITADRGVEDKSGALTLARGLAKMRNARGYAINWITNAVPYIGRLEDGYSGQAPAGMVQVTANKLRTFIAAKGRRR